MKKWIAVCLVGLALKGVALAQGTVIFSNNPLVSGSGGSSVDAPIFNVDMVTKLAGTGFSVQLYYGPLGALDANLTAVGPVQAFSTTPFNGYFGAPTVSMSGIAVGAKARLQVRAWDNQGGTITSWENATVRGASASFDSLVTGDSTNPTSIPALVGLNSFSLAVVGVPEPSVVALGLLGATGLLLRRRRS